ncbi:MAG: peptide deformylase [Bacteroidota bacterium]
MPVLPIYLYGQPVLRKKAKPVRAPSPELVRFAGDMLETMRGARGIGLAANQVGDLRRVIVVDISDAGEEYRNLPPLVMVNPAVVASEGMWIMEEGCLSIPDIRDEVEREESIRVEYRDLEFRSLQLAADGLLARVILHEIDHLNGVLFLDHLGTVRQRLLRGRLNKIRRGETDTAYPVAVLGSGGLIREEAVL